MSYQKTIWVNEVVENPKNYEIDDGTQVDEVTITRKPGSISQVGTEVDAEKMNNIEEGIETNETNLNNHIEQKASQANLGHIKVNPENIDPNGLLLFPEALPNGLIVMWSGSINNIPGGWALCDGTNGTPNLRDRFIVGAGGSYSPGSTGGNNSVTLTKSQMPSHKHDGDGFSTSAQPDHAHGPSFSTGTSGSHTHSSGTLSTATSGAHTHGGSTSTTGSHTHAYEDRTALSTGIGILNFEVDQSKNNSFFEVNRDTESAGNHSHSISTTSTGNHSHTVSGSTSPEGGHTHTISGGTTFNGGHSHTIEGETSETGEDQSHENRPPYYALAFIMKV